MKGITAIAVAMVIAAVGASWFLSNRLSPPSKLRRCSQTRPCQPSRKCRSSFGATPDRAFGSEIAGEPRGRNFVCGESVGKAGNRGRTPDGAFEYASSAPMASAV